jgi:hypothetical protein
MGSLVPFYEQAEFDKSGLKKRSRAAALSLQWQSRGCRRVLVPDYCARPRWQPGFHRNAADDVAEIRTGCSLLVLLLVLLRAFRNFNSAQEKSLSFPNADKPQPQKALTEWNSHGKNFHEFISVRVLFREPDFFAFFAKISLVTE